MQGLFAIMRSGMHDGGMRQRQRDSVGGAA